MRVFIAGAGRHRTRLVPQLVERGHEVVAHILAGQDGFCARSAPSPSRSTARPRAVLAAVRAAPTRSSTGDALPTAVSRNFNRMSRHEPAAHEGTTRSGRRLDVGAPVVAQSFAAPLARGAGR